MGEKRNMIILQNCSSSQQEVETPQTFRNYISGVGNYSITADDTKTSLRMYAFYRCNNLTSAIISGAVNRYPRCILSPRPFFLYVIPLSHSSVIVNISQSTTLWECVITYVCQRVR